MSSDANGAELESAQSPLDVFDISVLNSLDQAYFAPHEVTLIDGTKSEKLTKLSIGAAYNRYNRYNRSHWSLFPLRPLSRLPASTTHRESMQPLTKLLVLPRSRITTTELAVFIPEAPAMASEKTKRAIVLAAVVAATLIVAAAAAAAPVPAPRSRVHFLVIRLRLHLLALSLPVDISPYSCQIHAWRR